MYRLETNRAERSAILRFPRYRKGDILLIAVAGETQVCYHLVTLVVK